MYRNAILAGTLVALAACSGGSAIFLGVSYWGLRPAPDAGPRGASTVASQAAEPAGSPAALSKTQERMNHPDAKYAGDLAGPISALRRILVQKGADGDAATSGADPLVSKLREQRRDPDKYPWDELANEVQGLISAVRASPHGADPAVSPQLARLEQILAAHDAAKAALP
jgi:hypothetical protein